MGRRCCAEAGWEHGLTTGCRLRGALRLPRTLLAVRLRVVGRGASLRKRRGAMVGDDAPSKAGGMPDDKVVYKVVVKGWAYDPVDHLFSESPRGVLSQRCGSRACSHPGRFSGTSLGPSASTSSGCPWRRVAGTLGASPSPRCSPAWPWLARHCSWSPRLGWATPRAAIAFSGGGACIVALGPSRVGRRRGQMRRQGAGRAQASS